MSGREVLKYLLIVSYTSACVLSAWSPENGFILVGVVGGLVALGFFVFPALVSLVIGLFIGSMIIGASVAIPCLALILAVWPIINLIMRLDRFKQNAPFMLGSILVYGFLALSFLKNVAVISEFEHTYSWVVIVIGIVFGILGMLLMFVLIEVYREYGRRKSKTAVFLIAFPWYIVVFLVTILFVFWDVGTDFDLDTDADLDD